MIEQQILRHLGISGRIEDSTALVPIARLVRAHSDPEFFEIVLRVADGPSVVLTNDPSILLGDPDSAGWSWIEFSGLRKEDGLTSRLHLPIGGTWPVEACVRGRDESAVLQLAESITCALDDVTKKRNRLERIMSSPLGAVLLGSLAGYSAFSTLLVAKAPLRRFDWYSAVFFSDLTTLVQWALLAVAFLWGSIVLHRRVAARLTPEASTVRVPGSSKVDEGARLFAIFCALTLPVALRVTLRILL